MAMEARKNGLQKIDGLSSMGFCWWQVSKNDVGGKGKRASEEKRTIFDGLLLVESIEEWR